MPCETGITSSRVPCTMNVGQSILPILSMLQKRSPGRENRRLIATLWMDIKGLCNINPRTLFRCFRAMWHAAPDPKLRP